MHSTVSFFHKNIFAINHNTLTMQDLNLLSLQMHHYKLLLSWLPLLLLSLLLLLHLWLTAILQGHDRRVGGEFVGSKENTGTHIHVNTYQHTHTHTLFHTDTQTTLFLFSNKCEGHQSFLWGHCYPCSNVYPRLKARFSGYVCFMMDSSDSHLR